MLALAREPNPLLLAKSSSCPIVCLWLL